MSDSTYLVAGAKPWNRRIFDKKLRHEPGDWHFAGSPQELTVERVRELRPRFVFFLHWSWKVPTEFLSEFECVCFHMTDLPYGRGGSPLQNLIVRGHRQTKLSALRMTEGFDEGPVYMKRELSLEGAAEEIFLRANVLSAEMVIAMVREPRIPTPQEGEATVFKRRQSHQSAIPELESLDALHDFIRMLDAEGYPRAFVRHGKFRYEFSRAVRYDGRIAADVVISRIDPTQL